MNTSMIGRIWSALLFAVAIFAAQESFGALLVNYQFEEVFGTAPTQSTKDSSNTYADALNEVLGPGTTPGTNYPLHVSGVDLVANGSVKSVNPNSFMQFTGPNGANSNSSKVRILDASANGTPLDASFTKFTFATWVKPTFVPNDAVTDRLIAGKAGGGTSSSNRGWQVSSPPMQPSLVTGITGSLTVSGGDDLVFIYFPGSTGSTARTLVAQDVLPFDTWTHIAFAFDGAAGTEAIYVNGVAASFAADPTGLTSVPATLNGANAGSFMAGARAGTASGDGSRTNGIFGWYGGLDDVRVYDEALAPSAIGSASGVGSLLQVPEPSYWFSMVIAIPIAIILYRRAGVTALR
jgi:hypothetical protein